jgi:hypothetical protein
VEFQNRWEAVSVNVIIAIGYGVIALVGIIWFIERTSIHVQDHHWARFRRHGFTAWDLDASLLFGMATLLWNTVMHALDIAKVARAPWFDFIGSTTIIAVAIGYVLWRRRSSTLTHARTRLTVFFAPMLAAMAIDQYIDKAARLVERVYG